MFGSFSKHRGCPPSFHAFPWGSCNYTPFSDKLSCLCQGGSQGGRVPDSQPKWPNSFKLGIQRVSGQDTSMLCFGQIRYQGVQVSNCFWTLMVDHFPIKLGIRGWNLDEALIRSAAGHRKRSKQICHCLPRPKVVRAAFNVRLEKRSQVGSWNPIKKDKNTYGRRHGYGSKLGTPKNWTQLVDQDIYI